MKLLGTLVCFACLLGLSSCLPPQVEPEGQLECVGVYSLVTVDGKELPAVVKHGEHDTKVYSGIFTINEDGTCRSDIDFGPPKGSPRTRTVTATYTQKSNQLFMKWKGAGRTKGTVEADTFTMNNEGMIFAYRRQP